MEEIKKNNDAGTIVSEGFVSPTEGVEAVQNSSILEFAGAEGKEPKSQGKPRIPNTLSANIALAKFMGDDLKSELYKELEDSDKKLLHSDEPYKVDRRGKRVSLSVEEIALVKYISYHIPFNNENVRDTIAQINKMDEHGELPIFKDEYGNEKPLLPVYITIDLIDACRQIIGTTKKKDLVTMGKRLARLETIKQAQTFMIGKRKFECVRTLITIEDELNELFSNVRSKRGRKNKNENTEQEERILIGAKIKVSSLFLYEANNKYCPFDAERYFPIARKNKNELFQVLLADLESKRWQYYLKYKKETEWYRNDDNNKNILKEDKETFRKGLEQAQRTALTYSCNLQTLKTRVATDYESNRKMKIQFLLDIKKAVASCIEYGIITESHISSNGKNLLLIYNPNFGSNKHQIEDAQAEQI